MQWNRGLYEAYYHVFSARHTYATDFFSKLWYEIEVCILQNLLRQILAHVFKIIHNNIFISYFSIQNAILFVEKLTPSMFRAKGTFP